LVLRHLRGVFYLRGQKRYWLAGLGCLIAGPEILYLFPVWLLGFAVYHISKRDLMPKWAARTILAASAASLLVFLYLPCMVFNPRAPSLSGMPAASCSR